MSLDAIDSKRVLVEASRLSTIAGFRKIISQYFLNTGLISLDTLTGDYQLHDSASKP